MEAETTNKSELNKGQRIALIVAIGAGLTAVVLYTWARQGALLPGDEELLGQQLKAVAGIVTALLLETLVRAKKWTLAFASIGILTGAASPWLYRILPPDTFFRSLAHNLVSPAAGIFAFGVAFLVKSTERDRQ